MVDKSLDRLWRTARPRADLSRLPADISLAPAKRQGIFLVIFGLIWLAIISGIVVPLFSSNTSIDFWVRIFVIPFPLVGIGVLLYGVFQLNLSRTLNISKTNVSYTERSLLGGMSWQEPLSHYQGLRHYSHRISRKHGSSTYQIVELAHSDKARTVPLYVQPGMAVPRAIIEEYASVLDMRILGKATGDTIREVADLDKSIRELSEDGKFDNRFDPNSPVPGNLKIATTGSGDDAELEITILAPRIPRAVKVTMILFPILFGVGATLGGKTLFPLVIGAIVIGLVIWTIRRDRITPRIVRLTRFDITGEIGITTRSAVPQTLQFRAIEEVFVERDGNGRGRQIIVAGDAGSLKIGTGLSAKSLEWLRGYIAAAILTA